MVSAAGFNADTEIAKIEDEGVGIGVGILNFFKQIGSWLYNTFLWIGNKISDFITWSFDNPEKAAIMFGTLAILYA